MENNLKARKKKDNLLVSLVYLSAIITVGLLVVIVGFIFIKGMAKISPNFLFADYSASGNGGILPMIMTTVYMVLVSILVATPIGILAAVYLQEYAKQGKRLRPLCEGEGLLHSPAPLRSSDRSIGLSSSFRKKQRPAGPPEHGARHGPTGRAGHGARGNRCVDGRPVAGHGGYGADAAPAAAGGGRADGRLCGGPSGLQCDDARLAHARGPRSGRGTRRSGLRRGRRDCLHDL